MTDLPVLGWKEQVALPDWGVPRLRAKLDTGARTSALHVVGCDEIGSHEHEGEDLPLLRLTIEVGSRDQPERRHVEVPAVGYKMVRDTRSRPEQRPVVRTRIRCGPLDVETDVTLTDRSGMNFRMLLGRTALAGHCLVDPDRGYLVSPVPPRRSAG